MKNTPFRSALIFAIALAAVHARADEVDRLVALSRVWSTAKYLDPALASGNVDWDAALVRAIPAVRSAASGDAFAIAVDAMLRELSDPATRVVTMSDQRPAADTPLFNWSGDVLVVNAGAYDAAHEGKLIGSPPSLFEGLAKAKGAVIDLRAPANLTHDVAEFVAIFHNLTAKPLVTPPSRYVIRSGYPPQSGSAGGYYAGFLIPAGTVADPSPAAPSRIAFVVDKNSTLPAIALALREAGDAAIVSSEPAGNELAAERQAIRLDSTHVALVRVSEPAGAAVSVDLVDPDPLSAAIRFARGEIHVAAHAAGPPANPSAFPNARERAYAAMQPPDVNYRLLALYRFWNIIDRFYPYRSLIGDWDSTLREFIPRFIAADDSEKYGLAIRELDARVEDGHSAVIATNGFRLLSAEWPLPFGVRSIEGQYVITSIDSEANPPVNIGDVVLSIDGEPMDARVSRLSKYIPASTDAARKLRIGNGALWGPKGSTAQLDIRSEGGVRRVEVARVAHFAPPQPATPIYRVLDGNIGYVDLTRLDVAQVNEMFDALMKTDAIIFDMRGYPRAAGWFIAPRINSRHATTGAIFRRPEFSGATPFDQTRGGFFFEQPIEMTDKPLYRGKTVMLIDERALSQSEWNALLFEAANGTTFIGTPTAGAIGDTTDFALPGGFRVVFTGGDVRHVDGRPVQGIGIQPAIVVAPTIAAIRAGRDEVLERAIQYAYVK